MSLTAKPRGSRLHGACLPSAFARSSTPSGERGASGSPPAAARTDDTPASRPPGRPDGENRKEDFMETAESQVGKMEAELRRWGAKLDELIRKADAVGTGAKMDYRERLEDMKDKYEAARERLDELKVAGTGKWEIFKGGIEDAWNELEAAFRKLAN